MFSYTTVTFLVPQHNIFPDQSYEISGLSVISLSHHLHEETQIEIDIEIIYVSYIVKMTKRHAARILVISQIRTV